MSKQLIIGYGSSDDSQYIEAKDLKIKYYENYFNTDESVSYLAKLRKDIRWRSKTATVWGKKVVMKRKIAWYGDEGKSYTYSGLTVHPNKWNDTLLSIKEKIEIVSPIRYNSVLLNEYSNGEVGIGWHSDDEKELGRNPIIGSVSFGANRDFFLKHKTDKSLDKISINLKSGSLLLMFGNTQHHWKHAIPKRKMEKNQRINLTFRKII